MKFTEKYEILELLTSGRVSTFLARERATQTQAVVHTFECPATFSAESQNSSILKHFASLAPNPMEPVIEVGFDASSSSAFVVTRVPAASALQSWVHAYRSFPGGERSAGGHQGASVLDENATAELSASEVERLLRQSGRPKPQGAEAPSSISTEPFAVSTPADPTQKGEFTRLFEEPGAFQRLSGRGATGSSVPVPAEPIPARQPDTPAKVPARFPTGFPANYAADTPSAKASPDSAESASPGSFTQEFFSGTDAPSDQTGFGNVAASEKPATKEPGAFTKEFLAISGSKANTAKPAPDQGTNWQGAPAKVSSPAPMFSGKPKPPSPEPKAPPEKFDGGPEVLKSSTGEFTSFFRGPFDQPHPAEKQIEYPDPVQASTPSKAGDFTQMFGQDTAFGATETPGRTPERPPSTNPSITQLFSEEARNGARLGDLRLDPDRPASTPLKPPIGPTASPAGLPLAFSGTVSPVSPRGTGFSPAEAQRGSASDENPFQNRSGRSDATNVFKHRGADAPPVEPAAPSGPSDFTMFISSSQLKASLPPGPPVNAGAASPAARPPLAMPPMPSYAVPAPSPMPPAPVPQMAAPQLPQVPRPPAPSPRAASYWPLITVLTILFAVAALLVMYFALKH